ncbi:MAG: sulfotransferase, partial [Pseudomonadales bacterium]
YLIYGAYDPSQAPDLYRAKYETHNREVRDYFKDRPGKLLNLVIEDATWNSLCQFLGKPIPKSAFPHSNNSKGGSKLKALIKEQLT